MIKKVISLLAILAICHLASETCAQTAIGKWRDCLDASMVFHVAEGHDAFFAATRGGLFSYDPDYGTLTSFSKSTGLSDVGVATMAYDNTTQHLVIAYTNSNVDVLDGNHIYNISDIKRSEIAGNKSISHIRFNNGKAYLATGFGVVVLNLTRHEIEETWYLGTDGTRTIVHDLAFGSDSIYAATGEGMKHIARDDRHPGVSDRWSNDHRFDSLTITTLLPLGSQLLALGYSSNAAASSLMLSDSSQHTLIDHGEILNLHINHGKIIVVRRHRLDLYDQTMSIVNSITTDTYPYLSVNDAILGSDGTYWLGHQWDGLTQLTPAGIATVHRPEGPASNDRVYRLVPFNYRMMVCPGGHTSTYARSYYATDLFTEQHGQWSRLTKTSVVDGTSDLVDVAINPYDTTELCAALYGHGICSIRNNQTITLYNDTNTDGALIPYSSPTYTTLNTSAVAFDLLGNLWIAVSHSPNALAVRHKNGSWESFSTTAAAGYLQVDKLVCDSVTGFKWFCGRDNVIYVHDGESRFARVNPNNGSKLSTSSVTALAQDQLGNLWVGTNKGIKVIYDGYRAFQNGTNGEISPVNCSNITITNGEFSEYLMAYEGITAIAVDGANRKWVGTSTGGLYLLSANGMDQLAHFTAANSPLFADKIVAIGINERSGEVYIGTEYGTQVYRGTATYAVSTPLSEVYAFPNPVKNDYDGPIAIKGLTRNGIVHIVDAAGHIVFSTQANGGQAIWYGRTQSGDPVSSGVYYVFAADSQGDNHSVAKILVIR